jgi:lipopolysaccharide transport system permease protein
LLSWLFVFQVCLKIPPPKGAGDSFTLYLFCGYLPWLLFQETLQRSVTSIVDQSNLITKTVFPSEVIPVTVFLSALLSHAIATALVIAGVAVVLRHLSVMLAFLPVYTALLGLFAIGMAWFASSLQVYLRDISQVVIVLLTGWFWLTPIMIDSANFPHWAQFLLHLNPLAHVVRAYRERLLTYDMPSLEGLAYLALIASATFLAGGLFFRHLKRGFADVL